VISDATQRMVGGYFDIELLREQNLKGVSTPMRVCRVLGPKIITSRFDGQSEQSLTRFVGRETELAFLLKRWEDAKEADDQSVLLIGEAGIGKSRLVE